MKQTLRLVLTFCLLAFIAGDAAAQRIVRKSFARAERQTALLDSLLTSPDLFPASWNTDGTIKTNSARGWISGFFPANIWFLYEYTRDPKWLDMARRRTAPLDTLRRYTKTHDLGFMVGCPCAAAYRLTGEEAYRQLLIDASDALLTRFSPAVGLIRSWDNKNGDPNPYRVIIDNMMNLEMLFTVSKLTGDKRYYDIAVCHADNTLKNHFRPDNSCFHIVCYDAETGRVTGQRGGQGYSAASAWSRGQSWALYGFTMCYRETGDPRYLDRAVKCAEYFINHPRLPEDLVPYWDYDAPGIRVGSSHHRFGTARTGQIRPRKGKILLRDRPENPHVARFGPLPDSRREEVRLSDRPQRRVETLGFAGRRADHLWRLLFSRSFAPA